MLKMLLVFLLFCLAWFIIGYALWHGDKKKALKFVGAAIALTSLAFVSLGLIVTLF